MFATASPVRRWLLVEVRGAWGRDSVRDTELGAHVTAEWRQRLDDRFVRIIAVRRGMGRDDGTGEEDAAEARVELVYATSGHADDPRAVAWTRTVAGLDEVVAATADVPIDLERADPSGWQRLDAPLVLVCTNGRHDSCCATFGRPLVRAMRDSRWATALWECSHIGGDRFAANVVILPQGLYYGRVEPDEVESLLGAHDAGKLLLDRYRGRSTFGFGEQAAEYFVRREYGLDGIGDVSAIVVDRAHHEFDVTIAPGAGAGGSAEARTVAVRLRRVMTPSPTPLTCKGADGVAYPSYRVESLHEVAPGTVAGPG